MNDPETPDSSPTPPEAKGELPSVWLRRKKDGELAVGIRMDDHGNAVEYIPATRLREAEEKLAEAKHEYENICKFATDYEMQRDELRVKLKEVTARAEEEINTALNNQQNLHQRQCSELRKALTEATARAEKGEEDFHNAKCDFKFMYDQAKIKDSEIEAAQEEIRTLRIALRFYGNHFEDHWFGERARTALSAPSQVKEEAEE